MRLSSFIEIVCLNQKKKSFMRLDSCMKIVHIIRKNSDICRLFRVLVALVFVQFIFWSLGVLCKFVSGLILCFLDNLWFANLRAE